MRPQFLIALFCLSFAVWANDKPQQDKIQFVSHVSEKSSVKEKPGKETYEQYCTVCHRDGLVGAPRFRNEQDWQSRLKGRKLEDLITSSIKGLNAMPAKGTCSQCSEEDLKAAISYMLPKS